MSKGKVGIDPVVKEVTVPWPIERAFHRFTAEFGSWWPRRTHSVFQERAVACAFEAKSGGRIYETRDDGEISLWGTVVAIDAPHLVRFTWHPDREADTSQNVEVRFTAVGERTRVVITHTGWERLGDQAASTRADYDNGWNLVLAIYSERKTV